MWVMHQFYCQSCFCKVARNERCKLYFIEADKVVGNNVTAVRMP